MHVWQLTLRSCESLRSPSITGSVLARLDVSNSPVLPSVIEEVVASCPLLSLLDARGCVMPSSTAYADLAGRGDALEILQDPLQMEA